MGREMRWKKIAEPSMGTPRKRRLAPMRPAVSLAAACALVKVSARMAAAPAKSRALVKRGFQMPRIKSGRKSVVRIWTAMLAKLRGEPSWTAVRKTWKLTAQRSAL
jgi:hypothetical protein